MELLAPAGNLTKLKIALLYGADAVYLGGRAASLRSNAEFSIEELKPAVDYCRSLGKKAYITANIIPHNRDLGVMREYLQEVAKTAPDGVIISDLGVFDLCQKHAPNVPIHISTQANNTNYHAGIKWHEMGAKRIILARELTLDEIKEYRENASNSLELEVFVHGAMCMGYSGRCLISNYLTHRNANAGACAQPCRWEWTVDSRQPAVSKPQASTVKGRCLAEQDGGVRLSNGEQTIELHEGEPCWEWTVDSRQSAVSEPQASTVKGRCLAEQGGGVRLSNGEQTIELHESEPLSTTNCQLSTTGGTFFLNSKDMCLIRHLRELAKIGITSLKIEGRNKSEYYAAAVTKAYRTELDNIKNIRPFDEKLLDELEKVSHRPYSYNFGELDQIYGSSSYIRSMEVVGIAAEKEAFDAVVGATISRPHFEEPHSSLSTVNCQLLPCFQRGKICAGDALEILTPTGTNIKIERAEIFDPLTLAPIESTPHPEMPFYLKSPIPVPPNSFIRK